MLGLGYSFTSQSVMPRAGGPISLIGSHSLGPNVSLTRASEGSYFASNGQLTVAAANEPRFDYDPKSQAYRGLLVEAAATNQVPYSVPTVATWDEAGAGAITDELQSVYGISSALRLSSGGYNYDRMLSPSFSLPAGLMTIWAYVQIGPSGSVRVDVDGVVTGNRTSVRYDIAGDTLFSTSSGFGGVPVFKTENLFADWWRIEMTFDNTSGAEVATLAIGPYSITSGDWVDCALVQLETGGGYSSAIQTPATEVTRNADTLTIIGLSGLHDLSIIYDDNSVGTMTSVDLTGGYAPILARPRIKSMVATAI